MMCTILLSFAQYISPTFALLTMELRSSSSRWASYFAMHRARSSFRVAALAICLLGGFFFYLRRARSGHNKACTVRAGGSILLESTCIVSDAEGISSPP
jgi:hypothetical protein